MTKLAGVGRAVGLGLCWAVAWAPVAVAVGLGVIDPDNTHDEMWVAVGAYPGFVTGLVFSVLTGRRLLAELAVGRAAVLGALAGALAGALPFGIAEPTPAVPLWQLAGGFIGTVVALGAASAAVTVVAARALRRRQLQRA